MPTLACNLFMDLFEQRRELMERLAQYDRKIAEIAKADEQIQRLVAIPDVGPVTATAIIATVGDAKVFKDGRQFSAWIGLVPRQNISGGKPDSWGLPSAVIPIYACSWCRARRPSSVTQEAKRIIVLNGSERSSTDEANTRRWWPWLRVWRAPSGPC